ncbi:Urease accessory protein UreF [Burkholderiales bacterium 8X]|nr:Urease accessory protein UreF [Burkholderiales bacterium 8X]
MSETPAADSAAALLQLIWLASPALPIGGFSYSEGVEAAVEWAEIDNEDAASNWLSDQLALGLVRGDLAIVASAVQAWRDGDMAQVEALNRWVHATRESAEFRLQSRQMGKSLVDWLKLHHPDAERTFEGMTPAYPIAFAFAASRSGASVRDICLSHAFAWAENMVGAAVKAIPLGQSSGQRILARLAREIPESVHAAMTLAPEDRQAFCPMLAIFSARHETQYSRLFRS